jgi:hypothetical protein
LRAAAPAACGDPRVQGAQGGDFGGACVFGGHLGGGAFQNAAHLVQLDQFAVAELADDRAQARAVFDDAFGLEPTQGLAHGRARQVQAGGDIGFAQPVAGREIACADRGDQAGIGRLALAHVGGVHAALSNFVSAWIQGRHNAEIGRCQSRRTARVSNLFR